MMKFSMDAKMFKTVLDKVLTVINPKSKLTKVFLKIDDNGTLRMWGTNIDHYLEVRSEDVFNTSSGMLGIEIDGAKLITKMKGIISVEELDKKIDVQCGKKTIGIPKYENSEIFLPVMEDAEDIVSVKENWLLETLVNLNSYTDNHAPHSLMSVFNFNTQKGRVEALDGHCIGTRSLKNQKVLKVSDGREDTVRIHNMCVPVLKKCLDKKSEKEVIISQNEKKVKVEGKNFTYIAERVEGDYFDTEKILKISDEFEFIPNRENFLEIMKYCSSVISSSSERIPITLYSKNGKMYSYLRTKLCEVVDEVDLKNKPANFEICFNPQFLENVFSIVDSDYPRCIGVSAKSPIIIKGDEYSFLVLPVSSVRAKEDRENIEAYINRKTGNVI